jgi:hypothetical protein
MKTGYTLNKKLFYDEQRPIFNNRRLNQLIYQLSFVIHHCFIQSVTFNIMRLYKNNIEGHG